MDSTLIQELISGGETLTVEFKQRKNASKFNDDDLVETICCLANGQGGTLLVGVNDDGRVTGCAPFHKSTTDPARLEALIQSRTIPALDTRCSVHSIDGHDVLCVEVDKQPGPVCTNKGVYRHRVMKVDGPSCTAMEPAFLFSHFREAHNIDWALLPAHDLAVVDLDPAQFDRVREMARTIGADESLSLLEDEGILQALGLSTPMIPVTLGAVLLFGTRDQIARFIPNYELIFTALHGTKIIDSFQMVAPLFECLEKVESTINTHRRSEELQLGFFRVDLENIPSRVAREMICNALVHRDYTAMGPTQITLTDNAFSVTSPGGLPAGINLTNILQTSKPRSATLAQAFKRLHLVERTGRGLQIVFEQALLNGENEPDFAGTSNHLVMVNYPLSQADIEFASFIRQWTKKHSLDLTHMRIVRQLRSHKKLGVTNLSENLQLPISRIKNALPDLLDQNVIAEVGSQFRLGGSFYDTVGRRSDNIRGRELTMEELSNRILAYVAEYGSITRAEAEELCALSSQQTYRLLCSLTKEGKLIKTGRTKSMKYESPE